MANIGHSGVKSNAKQIDRLTQQTYLNILETTARSYGLIATLSEWQKRQHRRRFSSQLPSPISSVSVRG